MTWKAIKRSTWETVDAIRLENVTSRKAFYEVWIEAWDTYRVGVRYGKIGHNAIKETYTGDMGLDSAINYMEGKVKDKMRGDYSCVSRFDEPITRRDGSIALSGVSMPVMRKEDVPGNKPSKTPPKAAEVDAEEDLSIPSKNLFKAEEKTDEYAKKRSERAKKATWGSST